MINSKLAVSVVAAFGAMFGFGAASGADLAARYTKTPVYGAPPVSWTGCYIGGNIGAGWDHFNAGEVAFAGVATPFTDFGGNNGSSLIGGTTSLGSAAFGLALAKDNLTDARDTLGILGRRPRSSRLAW